MIKSVWKCMNIIAISPKSVMEQAEIIDTFWTYQSAGANFGPSRRKLGPWGRDWAVFFTPAAEKSPGGLVGGAAGDALRTLCLGFLVPPVSVAAGLPPVRVTAGLPRLLWSYGRGGTVDPGPCWWEASVFLCSFKFC